MNIGTDLITSWKQWDIGWKQCVSKHGIRSHLLKLNYLKILSLPQLSLHLGLCHQGPQFRLLPYNILSHYTIVWRKLVIVCLNTLCRNITSCNVYFHFVWDEAYDTENFLSKLMKIWDIPHLWKICVVYIICNLCTYIYLMYYCCRYLYMFNAYRSLCN